MRILLTGARDNLSDAIRTALSQAGHTLSEWGAGREARYAPLGHEPLDLREAVAGQEAVVHCGDDLNVRPAALVAALLAAVRATPSVRCLVYTSAIFRTAAGECCEVDEANAVARLAQRLADEALILTAAEARLTTAVVRPGRVVGGAQQYFVQYRLSAWPVGFVAYMERGRRSSAYADAASVACFYRRLVEDRPLTAVGALDDVAAGQPTELGRVVSQLAKRGGASQPPELGDEALPAVRRPGAARWPIEDPSSN